LPDVCNEGADWALTDHVSSLILLASSRGNIRGDAKADSDAVFVGIGIDIEAAEDGETATIVDIVADLDETGPEGRKGEISGADHGVRKAES